MPNNHELITQLHHHKSFHSSFISIFLTSLRIIFLEYPKLFLSIYLLTCLPLSLLLTALSLSSRRLRVRIFHLQWLSRAVQLLVESSNIHDESRLDLRSLLHLKALYALPVAAFSLLSLTSAVAATLGRRPELKPASRAAVTAAVNAAAWIAWASLTAAVTAAFGAPAVKFAVTAVEVGVMTVLSLALVVSVVEEAAGVAAVRVAWGLMKGRRMAPVGWVLSGLILIGSGFVGKSMEGGDWGMYEWTVRMRYGYTGGLIMLLGWVIMWSYVVFTVYYSECRKRVGSSSNISSSRELEECS